MQQTEVVAWVLTETEVFVVVGAVALTESNKKYM